MFHLSLLLNEQTCVIFQLNILRQTVLPLELGRQTGFFRKQKLTLNSIISENQDLSNEKVGLCYENWAKLVSLKQ